jgi:hypothetical protein
MGIADGRKPPAVIRTEGARAAKAARCRVERGVGPQAAARRLVKRMGIADGRKPPAVIRTEGAHAAKAAAAALTGALARRLPPGGSGGRGGDFPLCIPGPCCVSGLSGQLHQPGMQCQVTRPPSPVALSGQLSAGPAVFRVARVFGYACQVR